MEWSKNRGGLRSLQDAGLLCQGESPLAAVLAFGEIPAGKHACHTCDNPSCLNPKHLFLATNAENVRDMCAKGRGAFDELNGRRTHPESAPRGERVVTSKLTNDKVREIRRLYAAGNVSQYSLAQRFGVTSPAINCVVLRKTWQHVA